MDRDVIIDVFITSAAIFFILGCLWNMRKMMIGRAMPDEMADQAKREPPTPRQKLACWMGNHEWCSRTELGIDVDVEKANAPADEAVDYFFFFAAPVCKHCPTQLPPRIPE